MYYENYSLSPASPAIPNSLSSSNKRILSSVSLKICLIIKILIVEETLNLRME